MFRCNNRKCTLAAIGAALAAVALPAIADVKLYGKVHVSVDYLDAKGAGTGGDATSRRNIYVSSNSSRWGLDVSEKLANGLTAIAKLESELDATGETASQNSRNRYVGVRGGFGTLLAGVYDTPFKTIHNAVGFFEDQAGDFRNVASGTDQGNGTRGWDLRVANAIAYQSPDFSGFSAAYVYSADAVSATGVEDNRQRTDSLGLTYARGPLYVAFGHESHRYNSIADGGQPAETGRRVGAGYSFGAFRLAAMLQDLKDLGGTAPGATAVNRKSGTLGGAYTLGNDVFKLQYTRADKLSNASTGATLWAIGWEHLFSKTTRVYANYAKTDNESAAAFKVSGTGKGDSVTPATGLDPQVWSVGMVVDF